MTESPLLNKTQREILLAIGFVPQTNELDYTLDELEDARDALPAGSERRRRYANARSLLLNDDVAADRPRRDTAAMIESLRDDRESATNPPGAERVLVELPFDATRVARLLTTAASGAVRVALVNLATGAEFATVPLPDRSPESIARVVGVVRGMRDAMARPALPVEAPRAVRRGLNLVRQVEYTDNGVIYTERSGFAGSKAWAAQLVPREINITEARPRDYDYRFLDAFDESQSRSGRTGHANFSIVDEPDGVYVAESVWRSGESQREYFEVIDGSVTRHTPDVDEARSWMGLTEALDAKVKRLRAERSAVDREQSEKWSMAPLTAVSDKQRDYAERVRASFVQKFRTGPSYVKPLWPAVARVAKASWWLDYGNLQRRGINEILKDMLTAWALKEPVAAGSAAGSALAERIAYELIEDKYSPQEVAKSVARTLKQMSDGASAKGSGEARKQLRSRMMDIISTRDIADDSPFFEAFTATVIEALPRLLSGYMEPIEES